MDFRDNFDESFSLGQKLEGIRLPKSHKSSTDCLLYDLDSHAIRFALSMKPSSKTREKVTEKVVKDIISKVTKFKPRCLYVFVSHKVGNEEGNVLQNLNDMRNVMFHYEDVTKDSKSLLFLVPGNEFNALFMSDIRENLINYYAKRKLRILFSLYNNIIYLNDEEVTDEDLMKGKNILCTDDFRICSISLVNFPNFTVFCTSTNQFINREYIEEKLKIDYLHFNLFLYMQEKLQHLTPEMIMTGISTYPEIIDKDRKLIPENFARLCKFLAEVEKYVILSKVHSGFFQIILKSYKNKEIVKKLLLSPAHVESKMMIIESFLPDYLDRYSVLWDVMAMGMSTEHKKDTETDMELLYVYYFFDKEEKISEDLDELSNIIQENVKSYRFRKDYVPEYLNYLGSSIIGKSRGYPYQLFPLYREIVDYYGGMYEKLSIPPNKNNIVYAINSREKTKDLDPEVIQMMNVQKRRNRRTGLQDEEHFYIDSLWKLIYTMIIFPAGVWNDYVYGPLADDEDLSKYEIFQNTFSTRDKIPITFPIDKDTLLKINDVINKYSDQIADIWQPIKYDFTNRED